MDKLSIIGLSFKTLIGTYEWEQTTPQTLYADITFQTDAHNIAQSDDLTTAINYEAMAHAVQQFAEQYHFQLIETFAQRLASYLLNQFPIATIQLTVHKPTALPDAKDVMISIERHAT
jgi:dihydroneopterin aldolase